MSLLITALLTLFYLLSPFLILWLCHRVPLINKIGAVVMAYVTGLVLGSSGILPDFSINLQNILSSVTIPVAIPLMLFSVNLRECTHLARNGMISLFIGFGSVTLMVVSGYLFFSGEMDEMWKIGGLLTGVYTGGTPNLASLKLILDVDEEVYLVTHATDMLISAFYLLFLMTAGKNVFDFLLQKGERGEEGIKELKKENDEIFWGLLKRENALSLAKASGLAIMILLIGGGVSMLVPAKSQMVVAILSITTLGLAAGLSTRVNQLPKTFELGMYLVLVFSVVVASMVNISDVFNAPSVLYEYIAYVIFGSLLLQLFLSRIFKIDTDTMMVTSTALICSPPFVPVIAASLRNRKVVVIGLSIGLLGYAAGNYLGYIISNLLKAL